MDLTFPPLPQEDCIRVLECHVQPQTRCLICNFKLIPLDPCTEKYTAVSYAWEDLTPVGKLKFSNGQECHLSQTLSDLSTSLQHRRHFFTVWIDSICINQQDSQEKASQVRQMGKVFSFAANVHVWLGAGTTETKNAFQFMQSKRSLSWPDGWDQDVKRGSNLSPLKSVFLTLSRPWFRRVWVIQEVTLNKRVLISCGTDTVRLRAFKKSVFAIWKLWEGLFEYDDDHPANLGLWSATRMFNIRSEFRECGAVRYEILLQSAFECLATDKRDMVFAFRGIADKNRPVPAPDYTEATSADQVYRRTAEALLCHGNSLDILVLCGIYRQRSASLPTWVPDFRYYSFSNPFSPYDRWEWDIGGPLQESPRLVSPDKIQLQVRIFSVVDATCPVLCSVSVAEQKAAIGSILALRKRVSEDVSEQSWMHMIAMTLIFGLDLDDEPARPEYYDHFREYLKWLEASSFDDEISKISKNLYHRTLGPQIDGWKGFMTNTGTFCVGPPEVEVGDLICAVPGCRLSIILRMTLEAPTSQTVLQAMLVGWCASQHMVQKEAWVPREPLIKVILS